MDKQTKDALKAIIHGLRLLRNYNNADGERKRMDYKITEAIEEAERAVYVGQGRT